MSNTKNIETKNHVYHVIGGQYEKINYGSFDTLQKAKRCATAHPEYHDNFKDWVKPSIYVDDDCYPTYRWNGDKWVQLY